MIHHPRRLVRCNFVCAAVGGNRIEELPGQVDVLNKYYKDMPDFAILFCCFNNIGIMCKKDLTEFAVQQLYNM